MNTLAEAPTPSGGQVWRRAEVDMTAIDWLLMARLEEDGTVTDFLLANRENYMALPEWFADPIREAVQSLLSAEQIAERLQLIGHAAPRPPG